MNYLRKWLGGLKEEYILKVMKKEDKIFNEAIDLCNAHWAEKMKGIGRIIINFGQLTSKYPDKKHLLAGDDTFISASQYEDLVQAIINHLTKNQL